MAKPRPSLRSDNCPIWIGIGVRLFSESVSAFAGIRTQSWVACSDLIKRLGCSTTQAECAEQIINLRIFRKQQQANTLFRGSIGDGGFDVFLSYNRKDAATVRELKVKLIALGLKVWHDEDQLRPGIPWQGSLEKGIKVSRSVAVLIGPDGLGPWENEEMQAALGLAVRDKRSVIAVLLPGSSSRPELPLFLGNRTWVDMHGGFTFEGLAQLQWGITGNSPDVSALCHKSPIAEKARKRPTELDC